MYKILYEKLEYADGDALSLKLDTINARLDAIEKIQNERVGMKLSSDYINYDPVYGNNKRKIVQNFERNEMLATRGWNA